jgi:hypothetical protein
MSGSSVMGAFRQAVDATGQVWKPEKGPEPSTPPPPPDRSDPEVNAAGAKARQRGRALLSLNTTGPQGVTTSAPAQGKTLLGAA